MKLSDLYPLNLDSEVAKFEQDHTYNPQFVYAKEIPVSYLTSWGHVKEPFISLAKKILTEMSPKKKELSRTEKNMTQEEILDTIQTFFKHKGITQECQILFDVPQLPRCVVTHKRISFKKNLLISRTSFRSLFAHELETHFLRRYNSHLNQLPIEKQNDHCRTEEGLAVLHSLFFDPSWTPYENAARYYSIFLAQDKSFKQLYQELIQFPLSHEAALKTCLRVKRGLTDTSQPGSFTKDIVYLEGLVKVIRWIMNSKNNPTDLYIGRLTIEDLQKLKENTSAVRFQKVLPDFLENIHEYRTQVTAIAERSKLL